MTVDGRNCILFFFFFLSLSLFSPPLLRTMKFLFIKTNVKRDNVQLRAELKFLWIYERFLAFFPPPLFPFFLPLSLSLRERVTFTQVGTGLWNFFFITTGFVPDARRSNDPFTRPSRVKDSRERWRGFLGDSFIYIIRIFFLDRVSSRILNNLGLQIIRSFDSNRSPLFAIL